jgi:hypothetical protein
LLIRSGLVAGRRLTIVDERRAELFEFILEAGSAGDPGPQHEDLDVVPSLDQTFGRRDEPPRAAAA